MKSIFAIAAGLALLAPAAAPAAPAPASAQQCFYSRNISSWHSPDDNTVLIKVGVNDVYKLDLLGPCSGLTFAGESIGIRNRGGGGSSYICSALDVEVVVPGGIPNRCDVSKITKLTKEELAAIPQKNRP